MGCDVVPNRPADGMRSATLGLFLAAACLTGCHSEGELNTGTTKNQPICAAVWFNRDLSPVPLPFQIDRVSSALEEGGVHPTFDGGRVMVSSSDYYRAHEVLLTDRRLIDLPLRVISLIPAGAAVKTANGYEVPASAVKEDRGPSTSPNWTTTQP